MTINIEKIKNKIICGDALEILKNIKNESVDMILTDPPFMISQEIKIGRSANVIYRAKTDINLVYFNVK